MEVLKVDNIVKRYKELVALDHLSISVDEGEVFGLLGPNGSGKSTLINCILSLLTYSEGDVKVFGEEIRPDSYAVKRKIGVVPQNVAVFDELTVRENVDFFCGLYVKDKAERKACVDEAIEFVGLEEFTSFRPRKLSGGLLRRLNIACGIAHRPQLIFMDEPTVAVDPQSRNKILEGILKLNEAGATIVYTSHYMEEVEKICSRIAIIDKGRTIAVGTNDDLKGLISTSEKVRVEILGLSNEAIEAVKAQPHVLTVDYRDNHLNVTYGGGTHNLIRLLDYLKTSDISFGRVYSEVPTLNDVFLEITGKELRDQ
ncbi:MAG: ABC transporter ATP-binding protein [Lachnospiraceae bacterium]|nr:ABC transporter ATP-binding protein [Lachnospiraceae bacterium]